MGKKYILQLEIVKCKITRECAKLIGYKVYGIYIYIYIKKKGKVIQTFIYYEGEKNKKNKLDVRLITSLLYGNN